MQKWKYLLDNIRVREPSAFVERTVDNKVSQTKLWQSLIVLGALVSPGSIFGPFHPNKFPKLVSALTLIQSAETYREYIIGT